MSFSGTALEHRERELKALRTFLTFSLVGSLGLHISVLASGVINLLARVPEIKEEPIEVVVVEKALAIEKTKPVPEPIKPVNPRVEQLPKVPQPPKQEVVKTIKTPIVEPIKPVEPKPVVEPIKPVEPKPLRQKETALVPRKLQLKPQKITRTVTTPVEKPIPKPQPKVIEPTNTQNQPNLAPTQQPDDDLTQKLRELRNVKPTQGGGGGGGGGGGLPIATGSGSGVVATGSGGGTGTGRGTGTGSGIGSGTGSGIGSGTGSGIGSGTGSGIGSGTGSGIGSGTGSGIGSGTGSKTQVATAPRRPRPAVTKFDFVDCLKCELKYPERAERQGIQGKPGITFDVDNNGNVININLTRPSGHKELDEALVSQARKFKLNSAAAGKQNVQLVANFTKSGTRENREALQRQRDRTERRRQQQAEAEKKREAGATAANEAEVTPGRRRQRTIPDSPAAPTTPVLPSQKPENTVTPTTPVLPSQQPESTPQPLEQSPASPSPSSLEQTTPGNENDLRDSLRRSQEQP
ncbi:TonB family protein [Scytonema sp. NUACC26]|uniref:TonB family protein n=1 Tax=Scytonema sp. NUACC26 TaxID=3140176 RepID=UPI0034DC1493